MCHSIKILYKSKQHCLYHHELYLSTLTFDHSNFHPRVPYVCTGSLGPLTFDRPVGEILKKPMIVIYLFYLLCLSI